VAVLRKNGAADRGFQTMTHFLFFLFLFFPVFLLLPIYVSCFSVSSLFFLSLTVAQDRGEEEHW